ncbi:MAG TPA: RNA polymerase sigma factor [Cytophagales bacterium]|nr:RNA polymerase sigma factor [Cytophagales bacterium]
MDELELIAACQEHSLVAQKMLYKRYAPMLRGVCTRYMKNEEDAKDVLQDAFVEIYKCIPQYSGQGVFVGWLKKVVIHTAIDYIRKQRKYKHESLMDESIYEDETTEEALYLKLLDMPDYEAQLLHALQALPVILSAVFNMFYIDDLSHKEIAALLKIDEVTSRTRLNRARQMIKDNLMKIINVPTYERSA